MSFIKKIFRKFSRAFNAFNEDEVPSMKSLKPNLSRERLKRNCRILFIDDETVELITDLKNEGFSVDQDKLGSNISHIERGYFDLIVLDYKGVGAAYGLDEGLSLLKAIKRVNSSVYVLAYTSQNLSPIKSSEFYTLSDGTLDKDAGVADSIKRIEEALREAVDPERIWKGIIRSLGLNVASEETTKLEKRFVSAILKSRKDEALLALGENLGSSDSSLVSSLVEKLISFAIDRATS